MRQNERADASAQSIKDRLLPPSAIEALVERWIERLPRWRITAQLVPGPGVTAIPGSAEDFKAVSNAPRFELLLDDLSRCGGWFYLEGALARHSGSRQARLEMHSAAAAGSQAEVWPVTTNQRGSLREVVYLPADMAHLYWLPTAAPGLFSQSPLLVHRIGWLESVVRRLHRIALTRGQLARHGLPGAGRLGWWRAITRLQSTYRLACELRAAGTRGADYPQWLAQRDRLAPQLGCQLTAQAALVRPDIVLTLIVALDQAESDLLHGLVNSVLDQSYVHWELLLVGDAALPGVTLALAQQLAAKESRIRLHGLPGVATAARCVNYALAMARGSYIWVLGPHDLLYADALLCAALEASAEARPDLVYTDSDRLDAQGQRQQPAFKPDWNPGLFRAQDYLGPAVLLRLDWVRELSGYREGLDGALGYDLVLRRLRLPEPARICHVPRMLYGQRLQASLQQAVAHRSGLLALQDHLRAEGASVEEGDVPGLYRVHYPLSEPAPSVCMIVPTRDRLDVLAPCIASIRASTDYPDWELLIVDNGSVEPATLAFLQGVVADPRIRVLRHDQPFNYSALNNFAAGQTDAQVLALINNDLEVIARDWLREMVSHCIRPGIGAVGAKLLYADGLVQHAGVVLGIGGIAGHVHKFLPADQPGYGQRAASVQNLSAVTGACLVVRAALYRDAGGMDEAHLAVAFNDIDFCLRLRRLGYRNLYTPHALLVHHESISRGRDDTPSKMAAFRRESAYMQDTWGEQLRNDPAYNPNLTLESGDFSFARTIRTFSRKWHTKD